MSIVSLVTGFADSLLKLQEEFSEQNRFDVLEKDAAELGKAVIAEFLALTLSETDELIRNSGKRYGDYTIVRQAGRTLVTTVGDVTFRHTQFRSRKDGSYHFLLDEMMKLPVHERLSEQAEAKILREAAKGSYQRAADQLRVRD